MLIENRCSSAFPTVWNLLQKQHSRSITYSCTRRCGGLGDRLAATISVITYGILTNRTSMIDDKGLSSIFSFSNLLKRDIDQPILRCSSSSHLCNWLQKDFLIKHMKVSGIRRCQFCYWVKSNTQWGSMLRSLNLDKNIPLAASCLLHSKLSLQHLSPQPSEFEVGIHIRTFALHAPGERGRPEGYKDISMVECVKHAFSGFPKITTKTHAVLLSDSSETSLEAQQTISKENLTISISQTQPYHIDSIPQTQCHTCINSTITDWLRLAQTNTIFSACDRGRSSGFAMYAVLWGYGEKDISFYRSSREKNRCEWKKSFWNITDGTWLC